MKYIYAIIRKPGKSYLHTISLTNESKTIDLEEAYTANCVNIGNVVIMPKEYPDTKKQILKQGFEVTELEMSEFKKADGGLTCLSQLF